MSLEHANIKNEPRLIQRFCMVLVILVFQSTLAHKERRVHPLQHLCREL